MTIEHGNDTPSTRAAARVQATLLSTLHIKPNADQGQHLICTQATFFGCAALVHRLHLQPVAMHAHSCTLRQYFYGTDKSDASLAQVYQIESTSLALRGLSGQKAARLPWDKQPGACACAGLSRQHPTQ